MVVLILALIVVTALIIWMACNAESIPKDYCVLYCGTMGSGKTLMSVRTVKKACKRLLKAQKWIKRARVVLFPFRKKIDSACADILKPIDLYSTIPMNFKIRYKLFGKRAKVVAKPLEVDYIMGEKHLPENSIIYIGEFGKSIASQFDFDNPNVQVNLAMLMSFCRHWFCGKYGMIVLDEQAPSCVAKEVRVRIGKCANLSNFRKFTLFGFGFALIDCKYLDFTKDGETSINDSVEKVQVESGRTAEQKLLNRNAYYMLWLTPWSKKEYNSRAYRDIYYKGFTVQAPKEFDGLQTTYLPLVPYNEADVKEYKKDRRAYRFKYSNTLKKEISLKEAPQGGESE